MAWYGSGGGRLLVLTPFPGWPAACSDKGLVWIGGDPPRLFFGVGGSPQGPYQTQGPGMLLEGEPMPDFYLKFGAEFPLKII